MKKDNNNSKTAENNSGRGFASHPENINRNGRPRKGMAWSDVVIDIGEDELPNGTTKKEYIVQKVYDLAKNGEVKAIKLLWDSLVGNKQTIQHSGSMEHTVSFADVLKIIQDESRASTESKESV